MPTTTKKPSAELARLVKGREKAYAAMQGVKRQRAAYEAETAEMRAAYSSFVASRPEDHRDAAQNPKPDSPSGKKQAELKRRLNEPNPHERAFNLAVSKFHEADEALQEFRRVNLPDLIAESEPEFEAVSEQFRAALGQLAEAADGYAALKARVEGLVRDTDGINGQHVQSDPLPQQLRGVAGAALEHGLTAPGLTELGEWELSRRG
jgi:hypothetical protein